MSVADPNTAGVQSESSQEELRAEETRALAERLRLMRHGAINYSGDLLNGLVGIVLVPIILHSLGNEAYGFWSAT